MRSRDAAGLALAPLILRLMLATIFINAGLGKIMTTQELPPEQAARLANLGGLKVVRSAPGATRPADATAPGAPTTPLPDPTVPTPVEPTTPERTTPEPATGPGGGATSGGMPALVTLAQATGSSTGGTTGSTTGGTSGTPTYTASDFPEPVKVKSGLTIALMLEDAAHPAPRADGTTPMPLWPDRLSKRPWPVAFAWAATLTELIGGALLVIGLFTRLSALGISFTMLVAMWLTQIGPAIQVGGATLGFLPAYKAFDPAWMPLMFQFSLFAAASAVLFLGAGPASLDAAIFGGPAPTVVIKKAKSLDED